MSLWDELAALWEEEMREIVTGAMRGCLKMHMAGRGGVGHYILTSPSPHKKK